jgi:hypothetical protein
VAIESVDLANCYDAVAHPIASIALQSFKVCKVMVAMMLSSSLGDKTVAGSDRSCISSASFGIQII